MIIKYLHKSNLMIHEIASFSQEKRDTIVIYGQGLIFERAKGARAQVPNQQGAPKINILNV